MTSKDLEKWKQSWKNTTKIFLWGYGKNCRQHLPTLKEHYQIEAIIDNDPKKANEQAAGIPIILPDLKQLGHQKIVITTHYEEISSQLKAAGLEEYVNFCDLRLFISGSAWYGNKKIVLTEVHIAVTTGCTLNCKYCNMYMPFHKKQVANLPLDTLKEQLQLLFSYVDKILNLVLIGGETLIYKDLGAAIEYIGNNFKDKIDQIEIVTNGTMIPDQSLLETLRKNNVRISMSNYQLDDNYNERFQQVETLFLSQNIPVYVNQDLQWKNFSFPYEKLNLSEDAAYKNMDLCNPVFRGFNDSKLYFCHLVWSADKAGIFKEQDTDYVNFKTLEKEDREKIVLLEICCHDTGYVSLCKDCGGCSNRNQKFIPVGEQLP